MVVIDLRRKISNLFFFFLKISNLTNTYQVLPTCKVLKGKVGICISWVRLGSAAVTENP